MEYSDAQEKLNEVNKKIVENLNKSKMPISFYISEWLCSRSYPWVQSSFIDFRLDIDLHEIENVTDDKIYLLVHGRLIRNITSILDELKK